MMSNYADFRPMICDMLFKIELVFRLGFNFLSKSVWTHCVLASIDSSIIRSQLSLITVFC
jgi:hypothetical protein